MDAISDENRLAACSQTHELTELVLQYFQADGAHANKGMRTARVTTAVLVSKSDLPAQLTGAACSAAWSTVLYTACNRPRKRTISRLRRRIPRAVATR